MSTHSCCYPLLSRTLDETLFLPVMMGSTQHCYVSTYTLARSNHIPPINVFMSPLVAPGRTWKDKPRNVFLLNNEIMAKVLVAHSLSSRYNSAAFAVFFGQNMMFFLPLKPATQKQSSLGHMVDLNVGLDNPDHWAPQRLQVKRACSGLNHVSDCNCLHVSLTAKTQCTYTLIS